MYIVMDRITSIDIVVFSSFSSCCFCCHDRPIDVVVVFLFLFQVPLCIVILIACGSSGFNYIRTYLHIGLFCYCCCLLTLVLRINDLLNRVYYRIPTLNILHIRIYVIFKRSSSILISFL
jgi:hypothetical protein